MSIQSPERRIDEFLDGGVVIHRALIPDNLLGPIASKTFELLRLQGVDMTPDSRRFRTSKIGLIDELFSELRQVERLVPGFDGQQSTFRINLQDPNGGRQGWHQDAVSEPMVIYPIGSGFVDFLPDCETLEQARSGEFQPLSIPVNAGDVALIGCGSQIFHRGRNASQTDPRFTIVLH